MFTAEEATEERIAAYAAALDQELAGYQFRLKALGDGKQERLSKAALEARVKDVKAELARIKKVKPAAEPEADGEAEE